MYVYFSLTKYMYLFSDTLKLGTVPDIYHNVKYHARFTAR